MLKKILFSSVLLTSAFSIPVQAMDELAQESLTISAKHLKEGYEKGAIVRDDSYISVQSLSGVPSFNDMEKNYTASSSNNTFHFFEEKPAGWSGTQYIPSSLAFNFQVTCQPLPVFDLVENGRISMSSGSAFEIIKYPAIKVNKCGAFLVEQWGNWDASLAIQGEGVVTDQSCVFHQIKTVSMTYEKLRDAQGNLVLDAYGYEQNDYTRPITMGGSWDVFRLTLKKIENN